MPAIPILATLGPAELMDLLSQTTFFGKGILLILLVMSVMSWAVFYDKARTFARIRQGHTQFWNQLDAHLDNRLSMGELMEWCKLNSHLPLSNLILEIDNSSDVATVRRSAERVSYLEIENLERYLILLSTAVTISPFLGLLGTVWGIMSSFMDMASMQSANLTVVAPGIAEALITTIAGLATAIPAVIFYNMLVRKIDLVANEIDRLRTIMEEEAGGGRAAVGPAGRDTAKRPDVHNRETI